MATKKFCDCCNREIASYEDNAVFDIKSNNQGHFSLDICNYCEVELAEWRQIKKGEAKK